MGRRRVPVSRGPCTLAAEYFRDRIGGVSSQVSNGVANHFGFPVSQIPRGLGSAGYAVTGDLEPRQQKSTEELKRARHFSFYFRGFLLIGE
jgi:hypothetical protein